MSFIGSTASKRGAVQSAPMSPSGSLPAACAASTKRRQTGWQRPGTSSCHCSASIRRRNSISPARIEE